MANRETGNLIGSDKIEGTTVYGSDQQKIGSIERLMIDKLSGQVLYAVVSFGGFLGLGDDHYPLPWRSFKYDTNLDGYVADVSSDKLRGAPKYRDESRWNWSDPENGLSVDRFFGLLD
jgi:PRC-barrel domain